jgi:hypothetical protein
MRQAYNKMIDHYNENPEMTEAEIWVMMESFGVEYDEAAAERQWKKRKVAGLTARAKDEKGVRLIYATHNDSKQTVYPQST